MHFRQAVLRINNVEQFLTPNRANSFETFYVDFKETDEAGGTRYTVFIHPKQDIDVERLELQFDLSASPHSAFFANGYQSQSESRLLPSGSTLPRLRKIALPCLGYSGDERLNAFPRGSGALHSWTYTFLKDAPPGHCVFAGSLDEKTGFTLFRYDYPNAVLSVQKDLEHLPLSHSFPILDVWIGAGSEKDAFERYVQAGAWKKPETAFALGWTCENRHFTEETLLKNLRGVAESGLPFACFQIGDGWQAETGDWTRAKPGFPNGPAPIAAQIRAAGLKPGLWMAPFVASTRSELVRRNPAWLLKDKKGALLRAGWNAPWGGWYHALDFYNSQVRDYLSGIFHIITEKWGFDLLNLDFLFAACLAPPPGKTRGQVAYEAMEFLQRLSGRAKICVAGVPQGACFGMTDYMNLGNQASSAWENRLSVFLRHRERADAISALRNALGRWRQNGLFWSNVPGIFTLRKWTPSQQQTFLTLNILLGALPFTSDNPAEWTDDQRSDMEDALQWAGSRIESVEVFPNDVYCIDFEFKRKFYAAWCNLTGHPRKSVSRGAVINLQAYETLILRRSDAVCA